MATRTRLSLHEFLALPETEPPSEYIDGEVRQKVSPNVYHAALAGELVRLLGNFLTETGLGRVFTEMRHFSAELNRSYLPDVSVVLAPRLREAFQQKAVGWPPDFAIEILSPDDRAADALDKIELYQKLALPLLWIVDPDERTVREYRPGQIAEVKAPPDSISAAPVLPGFVLDLAELFAVIPGQGQD